MASNSEKDLTCPVCHDIFQEPVVLSCSHSFCKVCVHAWWGEKHINECPVCKARPLSEPHVSLALKNLCEAYLWEKAQSTSAGCEPLCSLHKEKLKLFCLDHQEPVCVVCRDAKAHKSHRFRPIDEAMQDHKEELQKHLKPLQEKMKLRENVKANCDQTAKHMKVQTRQTEKQIRDQFKTFYQFVQEEEKAQITALREEEKQKSRVIREKTVTLNREIAVISDTIMGAEKELRKADISFLQNYKATLQKVQQCPLLDEPQLLSDALIDEAKHLGNLAFNIWNQMKELVHYSPVIVDPNTAHPELTVSDDLTGVRNEERRKLPDNRERFDFYPSVLGSEGFNSGTHSWEVEVGDNTDWDLGVAAESVQRKGDIKSGLWRIELSHGTYAASSSSDSRIVLQVKILRRVRVQLDCDRRKVMFSDPDTKTQIHTFTLNLTGKMFPYFGIKNKKQLNILQSKVFVTVKQPDQ